MPGCSGLPNAGKSTCLRRRLGSQAEDRGLPLHHAASAAGCGHASATQGFVLADIPGLIEGASEGHGLGTRFLGHVERCAVLLHLIDVTGDDPVAAYRVDPQGAQGLCRRNSPGSPRSIAFNKTDLLPEDEIDDPPQANSSAGVRKTADADFGRHDEGRAGGDEDAAQGDRHIAPRRPQRG
jgi:GTP-binding protein